MVSHPTHTLEGIPPIDIQMAKQASGVLAYHVSTIPALDDTSHISTRQLLDHPKARSRKHPAEAERLLTRTPNENKEQWVHHILVCTTLGLCCAREASATGNADRNIVGKTLPSLTCVVGKNALDTISEIRVSTNTTQKATFSLGYEMHP